MVYAGENHCDPTHAVLLSEVFPHEESADLSQFFARYPDYELLCRLVRAAALRGWMPHDLSHECGTRINDFLFLAQSAGYIPHTLPPVLLHAWEEPILRHTSHVLSPHQTQSLIRHIRRCPSLTSSEKILRTEALTTLRQDDSPEQRNIAHRIHALLRKAESTTFSAEAEALIERAESLRHKYRCLFLSSQPTSEPYIRTECDASSPLQEGDIIALRYYISPPWVKHKFHLLHTIARACATRAFLLTPGGICALLGSAMDISHSIDLFSSLDRQCEYFMKLGPEAKVAEKNGQTSAFRRSFRTSYALRIGELLRRAHNKEPASQGTHTQNDLATYSPVIREQEKRIQAYSEELFPRTRTLSKRERLHVGGYQSGIAAAESAHRSGDSSGICSPPTASLTSRRAMIR